VFREIAVPASGQNQHRGAGLFPRCGRIRSKGGNVLRTLAERAGCVSFPEANWTKNERVGNSGFIGSNRTQRKRRDEKRDESETTKGHGSGAKSMRLDPRRQALRAGIPTTGRLAERNWRNRFLPTKKEMR
jgi:hypothetical protein